MKPADVNQPSPEEETAGSPAGKGYAMLRADIETALENAKKRQKEYSNASFGLRAHWYGRVAALKVLLQDDDDRSELLHTDVSTTRKT